MGADKADGLLKRESVYIEELCRMQRRKRGVVVVVDL